MARLAGGQPVHVQAGSVEGFPPDAMQPLRTGIGAPWGLAAAPSGAVYVASRDLGCVFRLDPGSIRVVAGWCNTNSYHASAAQPPANFSAVEESRPAVAAQLGRPTGLAVDRLGNIYIAEAGAHRVRRVDITTGLITTVAGTGRPGYGSDGGLAIQTTLDEPVAVAVDGAGNLYIAQDRVHRVRRVDALTRVITTVAGTGEFGDGGDGGAASSAQLFSPSGLALAGDASLYIADRGNHRVRRVDLRTHIIVTATGARGTQAGSAATSPTLEDPIGVAAGTRGELFVSDATNHRIIAVDSNGRGRVVAGSGQAGFGGDGGPAGDAQLNAPTALACAANGRLLIADTLNRRVRGLEADKIQTLAGDGGIGYVSDGEATQAFLRPRGLAVDDRGNVYIADGVAHRLRFVEAASATVSTLAGNGVPGFDGDGGPAVASLLDNPEDVAVDAAGNVYVADSANNRVRRIDHATGTITTLVGSAQWQTAEGGVRLERPSSLALGPDGALFVTDSIRVVRVDLTSGRSRLLACHRDARDPTRSLSGVTDLPGERPDLTGIAVGPSGEVFVMSGRGHQVLRIDPGAAVATAVAGNGLTGFSGDGGPAIEAALSSVFRLGLDREGNLLLADSANHRVRVVARSTGVISTLLDTERLGLEQGLTFSPLGVKVDPGGAIWVVNNSRIQRVDPSSRRLATVAGGGRGF
jgi:DNA-binding beta-propeller fold protein YncE